VQSVAKFLGDKTITLPCYENVDAKRVSEAVISYVEGQR
jgi:hypothetical protein